MRSWPRLRCWRVLECCGQLKPSHTWSMSRVQDGRLWNDSYLKMRKYRLYAAALSAESLGIQKDAQRLALVPSCLGHVRGIDRPKYARSLLVLSTGRRPLTALDLVLQVLVHGECDGLARRDAHYPRRYTLVECVDTFLPVSPQRVSWEGHDHQREALADNKKTHLNISPAITVILFRALTPSSAGVFCRRVLIVSIGALLRGPMAPLTSPIRVVCHPGSALPSSSGW